MDPAFLSYLNFDQGAAQGAEESCLTVMLAQFIAQIDLVIQKNERD